MMLREKDKPTERIVMAVDIGGSKFMTGFVSTDGEILAVERYEWKVRTPEGIVEQIGKAMAGIAAGHPHLTEQAVAGGVTIPALADPVRGLWVDSDFLDVHDLPICDLLAERLGVPFYGDNDCNACVLAESYFGGARDIDNFLYLTVSSGIGGGVFLGGDLYYGARYQAGEIGLTISEPDGRLSLSGNQRGPLEMYGGTAGMAQTYRELGGALSDMDDLGGKEIAEAARAGDVAALRTVELEGCYLGRAIANAAALVAPQRVVLGGGISLQFDLFQQPLFDELKRLGEAHVPVVFASELGYEGAFLAAAACARRGLDGFDCALGTGSEGVCVLGVAVHDDGPCVTNLMVSGRCVTNRKAPGLAGYLVSQGIADTGYALGDLVRGDRLNELVNRAEAGDLGSEEELAIMGQALGRALAFACMLLDPGTIRLAGGLARARAWLEPEVLEAIQRETYWAKGEVPSRMEWM